jgi:hypothetical protein
MRMTLIPSTRLRVPHFFWVQFCNGRADLPSCEQAHVEIGFNLLSSFLNADVCLHRGTDAGDEFGAVE